LDEDHHLKFNMSHSHHHHHNHAESNEAYFDSKGEELFASEDAKRVARQAADAFLSAIPFDKEKTTVLDFACGPGNISFNLAPHSKSIVGVDISGRMIDLYNEKAKKEGLSEQISAIRADIVQDPSPLGGKLFDIVVCSLSYHHFTNPGEITRALSHYLNPGGHIIIVDFMVAPKVNEEPSDEIKHIIAHGAFTEDAVGEFFSAGEVELKKYAYAFDMNFRGHQSKCFCAVGQKKD